MPESSPRTVAVTGSSGLSGQPLVARLQTAGYQVIRVVRSSPDPGDITWDPMAGTIDRAALDGVDAVVHLAGEGIGERRWTPAQKTRIRDSRTRGTELLASTLASLERPPAVLLSGSAIGYYGETGDRFVTENDPPGQGFLAEMAADWEAATAPATEAGIRTTLLRTGIILSPLGGALQRQLLPFRLGLGGRAGSGQQWQSWISIDDMVGAIAFLLDRDIPGPVNLTSPNPVTQADFARTLGGVLGRPTLLPTPVFAVKLALGAELVDNLLLGSQRVIPQALDEAGFRWVHPDLTTCLERLLKGGEES
ncbi:MAG: TIGR01777 family protein [Actinomycetia bacterium]|nr:TIGR01777 family protein [Actinomycetes bacterium]